MTTDTQARSVDHSKTESNRQTAGGQSDRQTAAAAAAELVVIILCGRRLEGLQLQSTALSPPRRHQVRPPPSIHLVHA